MEWAIRMHEPITGGTIYWLNDTVDGGPIAAQDWCFIHEGDTARELWTRELAPMGIRLFEQTLRDIEAGVIIKLPQDLDLAKWEPSFKGAPRLHRPDLKMLGDADHQVIRDRAEAKSRGSHRV